MKFYTGLDNAMAWAGAFATDHRMPYYTYYSGTGWTVTPKKPVGGLYYVSHPLKEVDSEAIGDELAERVW